MPCPNCGSKSTGGRFCSNCGQELAVTKDLHNEPLAWAPIRNRLESKWGDSITIESHELDSLSISDWRSFQHYLKNKTGDFLNCSDFEDYNIQVALSDRVSQGFWDTIESLRESLKKFQESLSPEVDSLKLIAVAGTLAKLSYGSPQSGQNYHYEAVENIENELMVLQDVLKIGKISNHIGESFDNHLEAIKLLSDFGKSFLVVYLGDTENERELLKTWAPRKGVLASDMTAAVIAGMSGEIIDIDTSAVINPRFIHMLIDSSNTTQPWWMEMALWASAAELWKEVTYLGPEDMDLGNLAALVRNAIDPKINKDPLALKLFTQEIEMYKNLLDFLDS